MKKSLMNILLGLFVVITLGFLVPVNASSATVDASMDNEQIQGAVNSNDEIVFEAGTYTDLSFTIASEKTFTTNGEVKFVGTGEVGSEGEINNAIVLTEKGSLTFNGTGTFNFSEYQNGIRVKGTDNKLVVNTAVTISGSLAAGTAGWSGNGIYTSTSGKFTVDINNSSLSLDKNGAGMVLYNSTVVVVNVVNGRFSTSNNTIFDGIYAHQSKSLTINLDNSTLDMNGNKKDGLASIGNAYVYLNNGSTMNASNNKGAGGINNGHVVSRDSFINANNNSYHGLTNISLSTFNSTVTVDGNGFRGLNINGSLSEVSDGKTEINNSIFKVTNNGQSGIYFLNSVGTKITNNSDITTCGNGKSNPNSTFAGDGIVASYEISIDNSYLTSIDPHSLATSNTKFSPSTVYIKEYTVYVAEGTGEVDSDVVDDPNSTHPEYTGTIVITGGSFKASSDVTVDNHEDYVENREDVSSTVDVVNDHGEDLYRFTLTTDNKEVGGEGKHEFTYQYHDSSDTLTYKFIFDKENKAYVWTPISRLYYNATEGMMNIDGSTAKMLDKLGFDITIYGNSMDLAERILASASREDYVFLGWYIADDSSLAEKYAEERNFEELYKLLNTEFTESTKLELDGMALEELTVYAKWGKKDIGKTDPEILPPNTSVSYSNNIGLLIISLVMSVTTVLYLKNN
ncbi:MAG: hypothetical protein UE699_06025 [Bacilli bacterium]|nr:hypothetical protein [Bacilli bacterium]